MNRKSGKRASARRLGLEHLEGRAMLAGNVTVSVTDGMLRVQGDTASNDIQIHQVGAVTENGLTVEISGRNAGNVATTTINGEESVIVEGITSGAVIGLGNGDNFLRVGQTQNDLQGRQPVHFPGRVTIGASSGRDRIALSIYNNTRVTVNSGAGSDSVYLVKSRFLNLFVNTDPAPAEGRDEAHNRDEVVLRSVTTLGACVIDTGIGTDEFRAVVANTTFWGAVNLNLGSGGDFFDMRGNVRASFNASLGSGEDRLRVSGTSTTILEIAMGDDNDDARVFSEFLAGITLDGGAGTDALDQNSSNPEGEETFTNFES